MVCELEGAASGWGIERGQAQIPGHRTEAGVLLRSGKIAWPMVAGSATASHTAKAKRFSSLGETRA